MSASAGSTSEPGLVVFLHGHSASPNELADLGDRLGLGAPWRIVVPAAPGRGHDEPGSWFATGDRGVIGSDLERAGDHLEAVIDAVLHDSAVPRSRLVLAGFSQGAAMALTLAARGVARDARLLLCSGWLPEAVGTELDLTAAGAASALVQFRRDDEVVPPELTRWSADALELSGCAVAVVDYEGRHGLSDEMLRDAGEWIAAG